MSDSPRLRASDLGTDTAEALLAESASGDEEHQLTFRLRAAEQLLDSGHVGRGLEVLLPVLRTRGVPSPRTQRGAVLSLGWHRLRLRLRGLSWTERGPEQISGAVLARLDAFQAAVRAFSMVDTVRSAELQVRGLRQALAAGEPTRAAVALLYEVPHLASMGGRGVSRARRLLDAGRAAAARCESRRLDTLVPATHGMLSLYGGDLAGARERLGQADVGDADESPLLLSELSRVRLHRLFTARYAGETADLSRWLARYLDDAARRGDRYSETTMSRGNSVAWLAADKPDPDVPVVGVGVGAVVDLEPHERPGVDGGLGRLPTEPARDVLVGGSSASSTSKGRSPRSSASTVSPAGPRTTRQVVVSRSLRPWSGSPAVTPESRTQTGRQVTRPWPKLASVCTESSASGLPCSSTPRIRGGSLAPRTEKGRQLLPGSGRPSSATHSRPS